MKGAKPLRKTGRRKGKIGEAVRDLEKGRKKGLLLRAVGVAQLNEAEGRELGLPIVGEDHLKDALEESGVSILLGRLILLIGVAGEGLGGHSLLPRQPQDRLGIFIPSVFGVLERARARGNDKETSGNTGRIIIERSGGRLVQVLTIDESEATRCS